MKFREQTFRTRNRKDGVVASFAKSKPSNFVSFWRDGGDLLEIEQFFKLVCSFFFFFPSISLEKEYL